MKILIVGGVAGGASAATRLRRLDERAEIILFEKGPYVSYANCGLPYYIGGVIAEKEKLLVTKPELLRRRFCIDVRTENEVTAIDRAAKKVTVRDLRTNRTYEESYDKLLLSPGAAPKRLPVEGNDLEGVFTLRTVPDTLAIDAYIREKRVKQAVVVGAGFIGVEMAENLKKRGLDVTIVEFLDQAVGSLDREMAAVLHGHLREKGISLRLRTAVEGLERANHGLRVRLADGGALEAELVLISAGVAPDSRLAKEAGLALGPGGSIRVEDTFATSDPSIYAVGDAVCVRHIVSGAETLLPLAGPANKQGRIAAENMLGNRTIHWKGIQGSAVLKVFDLTAASTGLNEKQLRQLSISYRKTYVHPADHATYYPGATQLSMKLLFAPDGRLLGAQAIGREGVDKRIDVIAAVMRMGGTVADLEELELGYAPPYSSAKDPVNILGFTAANILNGSMPVVYAEELEDRLQDALLLDVRTAAEARGGGISGAMQIPVDELRERIGELPAGRPVILYCAVGLRGYIAQRILLQQGIEAYNLSGGYKTYQMVFPEKDLSAVPSRVDCAGLPCKG